MDFLARHEIRRAHFHRPCKVIRHLRGILSITAFHCYGHGIARLHILAHSTGYRRGLLARLVLIDDVVSGYDVDIYRCFRRSRVLRKVVGRRSGRSIASGIGHRDFRRHFMDRRILELTAVHLQFIAVGAVAVAHKHGITEHLVAKLQLHAIGNIDGVFAHRHRALQRHAVFRSSFLYVQDLVAVGCRQLKRDGNCRRNGIYLFWNIIPAGSRSISFRIHIVTQPTNIQTVKTVKPVKKVCACVLMIAGAVSLPRIGGRTGSRHQVGFIHGREEVLTGNLNTLHREGRHVLAGIGRIEIFKLETAPVLEGQDKIVSGTRQRGGICRKIKNKTGLRFTNNILGYTRSGLYKAHIRHGCLLEKEGAGKRK